MRVSMGGPQYWFPVSLVFIVCPDERIHFYSIHWHFTWWKQTDGLHEKHRSVKWTKLSSLPRPLLLHICVHSFFHVMSKHFRSFLTLFSFSVAEKRPREKKTYLWCPLLSIITIIIIIFTSSVSSLHQEHSHNQILRNLKYFALCIHCVL